MDLDGDDQAMAQALGFSSFGAQDRPQKKRKYNPHADAAGLVSQAPSHAPPKQASTGSNSTPLGPSTRPVAGQAASNTDEIALEDDEDTIPQAPLDTEASQGTADGETTAGNAQAPVRTHGLPQRPPPSNTTSQRSHHNHGRHHGGDAERPPWFEGYYDPSSNENPWKRLEDILGLTPKGSWLSRDVRPVPTQ